MFMSLHDPFLPLIAETLSATSATSVLCLGELPWPSQGPQALTLAMDEKTLLQLEGATRVELAIMCIPRTMAARDVRQIIARLRDVQARQILIFVPENLLDGTTLRGLGLTHQAQLERADGPWQAWSYDIRTYKAVPDWLNPKFWANPENWNKYRW